MTLWTSISKSKIRHKKWVKSMNFIWVWDYWMWIFLLAIELISFPSSQVLFRVIQANISRGWSLKDQVLIQYFCKNEEALQCFEKCLTMDSNDAAAWNGKGLCYYALGQYEKSKECFDRAMETTRHPMLWYNKVLHKRMYSNKSTDTSWIRISWCYNWTLNFCSFERSKKDSSIFWGDPES